MNAHRKRGFVRRHKIVIAGAVILATFAAAGVAGATSAPKPAGNPAKPSNPVAATPAPAPSPRVVLSAHGNGQYETKSFVTGANWDLTYTYNCASFGYPGNFTVTRGGAEGGIDVLVNTLGDSGETTTHIHDQSGRQYLKIDSECDWSVVVTDLGNGG